MSERATSLQAVKELPQFADSANKFTAEVYLADLGLNWKALEGKEILDIGAGLARFAQVARSRGIQVTSLDLHPEWHTETGVIPTNIPYLIADARNLLPFPDERFDLIIARAAVHSMVDTREDLENVLHEANRLLRKGGEFRFGPGIIDVPDREAVTEGEWSKLFQYYNRQERGDKFTEKEEKELERLQAITDSEVEKGNQEKEELEGLSQDERIERLKQKSLE